MNPRYVPNYLMYSRPPQDGQWHDEPFEYVFSFAKTYTGIVISTSDQFDFLNQPLQFDPDADFFLRGIAFLIDNVPTGKTTFRVDFNVRLRNAYGRALDSGFIPMQAYATSPQNLNNAAFGPEPGSPVATPWYPEMYCPANGAMFADFQAQPTPTGASVVNASYSFHLYLQGMKRFRNEECKPGNSESGSGKVGRAA